MLILQFRQTAPLILQVTDMNFSKCNFRLLTATVLIGLMFCSTAIADNGFWISKGTSTGTPSRTIRKKTITPVAKPPVKKKREKPAVTEPVVAEVKPAAIENLPAEPDPSMTAIEPTNQPANEKTPSTQEISAQPVTPAATGSTQSPTEDGAYVGVTFSNPVQQKWRVGVVLITGSNPAKEVFTYIPIPKEWPEQTVTTFDEQIPVEFAVQKTDELDGLNRLILRGRLLPAKKKIVALQTFMVTTNRVNSPPDTTIFSVPDSKDKLVKQFTASGSDISYRNNTLRKQAEELFEPEGTAWEKVERIFDWVRDNIDQSEDEPYGTVTTFAKKAGSPEDVVGLFIAMCRANKVPARMVFVDGSQYAEFMLADPAGKLHWFPCDIVGIRAFGKIVEPKVILQKGDNIRVPGVKGKKKFVAAYGEVKSATAPKAMHFVREPIN